MLLLVGVVCLAADAAGKGVGRVMLPAVYVAAVHAAVHLVGIIPHDADDAAQRTFAYQSGHVSTASDLAIPHFCGYTSQIHVERPHRLGDL